MSRRIDIELTSSQADGSWTWRAAGAKVPKGVLDGTILPDGAKVGDELKVEVEQEIDGITVLGIVPGRAKAERDNVLELISNDSFEPVTQQLAKRDRGARRDDRDRGRRSDDRGRGRRDRSGPPSDGRPGGRDGAPRRERDDATRGRRGAGGERRERSRPSFTPPPEVPKRPKPKRLRPGSTRRNEVLADLPEEQRPIAELALQGIPAVRQRLREENERLIADGKSPMPEASVLKLAEELLPRLRVAEWHDRADAAKRQLAHLDLRDLRSVVAASEDPIVARDESTRSVAEELKSALVRKQDEELQLWFGDITTALEIGRVIRALRLSSQPPKAGVPFPAELAQKLAAGTNATLTPADGPDRWAAVLEAAAFSPIRAAIAPTELPATVSNELTATVKRLGPALPQIAALFGVDVPAKAPMPKPLRVPPRPKAGASAPAAQSPKPKAPKPKPADSKPDDAKPADSKAPEPAAEAVESEQAAAEATPEATEATPEPTPAATEPAADAVEPTPEATPAAETTPAATEPAADAAEPTPEANEPEQAAAEPTTEVVDADAAVDDVTSVES